MRRQEGRTRAEELRNKTSDGTQKEKKKSEKKQKNGVEQSNNMTQHLQGNTPPSSHHLFSNFPPPPCLLLLSPPISLCLSGTRTRSSPSHYHSSSGTLAVDAAVNSHVLPPRHPCSSAEPVRSRLLPYAGKVVRPFPER